MRITSAFFGDPPYNRSALAERRGEYFTPPPPPQESILSSPRDHEEAIRRMAAEGKTNGEIADELNIGREYLRNWCRKRGIKIRKAARVEALIQEASA